MITLIRMMILKYLKVKWELAFWQEFNKQANELIKHPENIEKKLLPYLAQIIHDSKITNNEAIDKYREKVSNEFNRQMNS